MAEFKTHLRELNVAVFDGVFGNPTCAQVMAGATAFKAHGADSVIGFGGGAALDVAKVVGVMATHAGDVLEYVWDHPQVRPIINELPYFVALPTTVGHRLRSRPLVGGVGERHAPQAHGVQRRRSWPRPCSPTPS